MLFTHTKNYSDALLILKNETIARMQRAYYVDVKDRLDELLVAIEKTEDIYSQDLSLTDKIQEMRQQGLSVFATVLSEGRYSYFSALLDSITLYGLIDNV